MRKYYNNQFGQKTGEEQNAGFYEISKEKKKRRICTGKRGRNTTVG